MIPHLILTLKLLLTSLLLLVNCFDSKTIFVARKLPHAYDSLYELGSLNNPCTDLDCAILLAERNSTIFIDAGVYSGTNNSNIFQSNNEDLHYNLKIIGLGNPQDVIISCDTSEARFINIYSNNIAFIGNITIQDCNEKSDSFSEESLQRIGIGGGALSIQNTSLVIENSILRNNSAMNGGALLISNNASVTIRNCVFEDNTAVTQGGAVHIISSSVDIRNSAFMNNEIIDLTVYHIPPISVETNVAGSGGAISFDAVSTSDLSSDIHRLYLSDNIFMNNIANQFGGAIFLQSIGVNTDIFVSLRDQFLYNSAGSTTQTSCLSSITCDVRGGAIYLNAINSRIENSTFVGNFLVTATATNQNSLGGAIYATFGFNFASSSFALNRELLINFVEFISNSATGSGGALYVVNQRMILMDTIFRNNSAGKRTDLFIDLVSAGGALWFSTSSSNAVSVMQRCVFTSNEVYGGWGGGMYLTETASSIDITNSIFDSNTAVSSYIFQGQGGALMASHGAKLTLQDCQFIRNVASPCKSQVPLTLSGSGGALYIQSATANITDSTFIYNSALTGQFDAGGQGGAVAFIDVNDGSVTNCHFMNNGALGFYGYSSYASSGTGGALLIKFSNVITRSSKFESNYVSVGGSQSSVGGAIAIFFESTSSVSPMLISDCTFEDNVAFSSTCGYIGTQSGQGGAISIVGVSANGIVIESSSFIRNVATSSEVKSTVSYGAALSVSLGTSLNVSRCMFRDNAVYGGAGADLNSNSGSDNSLGNSIIVGESSFQLLSTEAFILMTSKLLILQQLTCAAVDLTKIPVLHITYRYNDKSKESFKYQQVLKMYETENLYQTSDQIISKENNFDLDFGNPVNDSIPSIVIGDGKAMFMSSRFESQGYFIFAGDVSIVLNPSLSSKASPTSCIVTILENTTDMLSIDSLPRLKLVALYSIVSVISAGVVNVAIEELHLYNSTFLFLNNVTVFSNSSLVGSVVSRISQSWITRIQSSFQVIPFVALDDISLPQISFMGNVDTGTGFGWSFITIDRDDDNTHRVPSIILSLLSAIKSQLVFDGCIASFTSILSLTSPQQSLTSNGNLAIEMKQNALLNITETAIAFIVANTIISTKNDLSLAVLNYGKIVLSRVYEANEFIEYISNNNQLGLSLFSKLTVVGVLQQASSAMMYVVLNNTIQSQPVIILSTNKSLSGRLIVSFSSDKPNLNLYDSSIAISQFTIASYHNIERSNETPIQFIAPPGLIFTNTLVKSGDVYIESLKLNQIECNLMFSDLSYRSDIFVDSTKYPCFVCLQNPNCRYCENAKTCISLDDQCNVNNVKEEAFSNCCESNCNDPHGTCQGNSDHSDFSCSCDRFYTGDTCHDLSIQSILLITAGVFVFIFICTSFVYYRYFVLQKRSVLEDLKQGLLSGNDNFSTNINSNYIATVQQALILKDVFVPYEEIKFEKTIGEGSFGIVFKGVFRGAEVAVKQVRSNVLTLSEEELNDFRKEAYMMCRLRHPNIVLVMGISFVNLSYQSPSVNTNVSTSVSSPPLKTNRHNSWNDSSGSSSPGSLSSKANTTINQSIVIISEFMDLGSLADVLYGPNKLPSETFTYELVLNCACQAACGMLYLHSYSPPICHRDLKSSNLVVDRNWIVKVTDFGMSRIMPEKLNSFVSTTTTNIIHEDVSSPNSETFQPEMTSNMGTTAYCAPELLTNNNKTVYSIKVDIYSFGMVLWELWEKKRPFDELTSRFDIIDAIKAGERPLISSNCPPAYRSLIERCWEAEASRRPTFQAIVKYLKEELATVKRQKAALNLLSPSRSNSTTLNSKLLSTPPLSLSKMLFSSLSSETVNVEKAMKDEKNIEWKDSMNDIQYGPLLQSSESNDNNNQTNIKSNNSISFSSPIISRTATSWRDRYVVNRTWNSQQPDEGLPPTFATSNSIGSIPVSDESEI